MKQITLIMVVAALIALYGPVAYCQINELHAGVDRGELLAGGTYSVNEKLSAMLEYYEKSGVGIGVFYDQGPWKADLIYRPTEWETRISSRTLGHLKIKVDNETDKKSGSMSLKYSDIVATGSLSSKPEKTTGNVNISHRGDNSSTRLRWRFKGEEERLNNYNLTHNLKLDKHSIEATYQNNEYGSDLVGEGFEILWNPPWDFIRVGTGHFHETETDVSDWRHRLRLQKELTHRHGLTLFGLGGGIEGFLYGGGDKRHELTLSGRIRQSWKNGYGEVKLKRIGRSGPTPFTFDAKDKLDYLATITLDQRVGKIESNLTVNYDILDQEWRKARGTFDIDFTDNISGRLIADYDLDEEPEADQSTFMTELRYKETMDIRARAAFNYQLEPLTAFLRCGLPVNEDRLGVEVSYDLELSQLESVRGTYDFDGSRRIALEYNALRPKVMMSYRVAAW